MLQAFVTTFREGIEAALAIAIVLAYLKRVDRQELNRPVYLGLWTAVAASIVGGIVFHRFALNEDAYEGYFLVIGGVLVASLIAWMMHTAKGLKGEIEGRLSQILGSDPQRAARTVFLFIFLMVGREGIETVLMLSAVSLNTSALLSFAGGLLGLAAAAAFGALFVRGSLKVNLRVFFRVTTAILFLVAAQLLISGLHELSESKILPSSTREMAIVGPIVNNSVFFFLAILALCAVLFLVNRPPRPAPTAEQAGRAKWRLEMADYDRQQRARVVGSLAALALSAALCVEFLHQRALAQPPAARDLRVENAEVTVPVDELRDGRLHLFRITVSGKTLRFMLVRDAPGRVRAAFDACGICEKTFFYQSGENVFCSNCGASIFLPSIGQEGGCNPVPLRSSLRDLRVHIDAADLEKERNRF